MEWCIVTLFYNSSFLLFILFLFSFIFLSNLKLLSLSVNWIENIESVKTLLIFFQYVDKLSIWHCQFDRSPLIAQGYLGKPLMIWIWVNLNSRQLPWSEHWTCPLLGSEALHFIVILVRSPIIHILDFKVPLNLRF